MLHKVLVTHQKLAQKLIALVILSIYCDNYVEVASMCDADLMRAVV